MAGGWYYVTSSLARYSKQEIMNHRRLVCYEYRIETSMWLVLCNIFFGEVFKRDNDIIGDWFDMNR